MIGFGRIGIASALLAATALSSASAGEVHKPALGVVVHDVLGGSIIGYDVDRNGTEGILAEYITLQDLKTDIAVETFDQATGKIMKIVKEKKDTEDAFVTFPVVGTSVGFVEEEFAGFAKPVHKRTYNLIDPLGNNKFNGSWTPKLTKNDIINGISENQGSNTTAILYFNDGNFSFPSYVFGTDVTANTFGPKVELKEPAFSEANLPVIAFDSTTNQAVVAGGGNNTPTIALVDVVKGTKTEFAALGSGYMNGVAVDSDDGIAVTATSKDFSLEYYDLATQAGFTVKMQGAQSEQESGQDVEYDPVNKLFLVGQIVSSTGSGSSVQVYDTKGNFVESINGLSLPGNPATIALNPNTRTAFVYVTPDGNSLQGFTY